MDLRPATAREAGRAEPNSSHEQILGTHLSSPSRSMRRTTACCASADTPVGAIAIPSFGCPEVGRRTEVDDKVLPIRRPRIGIGGPIKPRRLPSRQATHTPDNLRLIQRGGRDPQSPLSMATRSRYHRDSGRRTGLHHHGRRSTARDQRAGDQGSEHAGPVFRPGSEVDC